MSDTIINRLNSVQRIPKEYLSETPPVPRTVKIELSPRCNFRCQYCSILSRKEQPKGDMDFDLFKRITQEMRNLSVEEIGPFLIGEPFINPGLLVRAIRYLKEIGTPYVFLTTNGSLASLDNVEGCMAEGLDSLKWSCNAADDKQFSTLTGVSEKIFGKVILNIKMAWRKRQTRNFKTKLYASSIHYDEKQRKRMKPLLEKNILPYVDQHYWLPLYSMGGLAVEREAGLELKPVPGNSGRYDDPVDPIPCWTLFTSGHVLADGRMTACCADGTGNWVVGDLKSQGFMEVWHSELFRELRRSHLRGNITGTKCEKCALL